MHTINRESREAIDRLHNKYVTEIVEHYSALCKPEKVTVITDSEEDAEYIRKRALEKGEEKKLNIEGHSVHFDNYHDQARDKENTRILVPKGKAINRNIMTKDRNEGLKEIFELMDGCMKGKEMFVCFYSLGPNSSIFTIPALQITDSAYVAHNENLLYRNGYKEFKTLGGSNEFFHFIHSSGALTEQNTSKNIDKRRIYIDLDERRVLSINTQYGGNSIGLKKLSLRLAINKASREGWLCEHMFIMGIHPKANERTTYFAGAFPSMCGKTSTAMVSGQTIVGDDIAYLKIDREGRAKAANVERGMFGIIEGINASDDPLLYKAITTPKEIIFSNILEDGGSAYWNEMGKEIPKKGINYSGAWFEGKKDKNGKEIPPSHKNARFTLRLNSLDNIDVHADNPDGVPIRGIIYGGRDTHTSVPVAESMSWQHGVFIGASLESETTAAALGKEGEREHNPMANLDFLVIPLGEYIQNHLRFGNACAHPPRIFSTNYYLSENGAFLNGKMDKKVWLLWMEGRIHNEFSAIETPIGLIPKYDDCKQLFKNALNKEYGMEDYSKQFSVRIDKHLNKLDRIEKIYREEENIPESFTHELNMQRQRLLRAREKWGKDVVSPFDFE